MSFKPTRPRRFLIILVELFLILQLYQLLRDTLGLPFNVFLLVFFVFFWFFNYFLAKIQVAGGNQSTIIFKILPRMQFSSDLFGVLIAFAIVLGFFAAQALGSAFMVYVLIVLVGAFAVRLLYFKRNLLRSSWGLSLLGFCFGVAIGNHYVNHVVLVILFLIGGLFLYLSHQPGEL